MDHVIKVELMVKASPNPGQEIMPGDTVTWVLGESAAGMDLQVVFKQIEPMDGSEPQPTDGPFSQVSASADRIVGTVRDSVEKGRFLYDFFAGDTKLGWVNRLERKHNFGGLDVPPPPPRG